MSGPRTEATLVLEGMLSLQRMRGRLSKVSVNDVTELLALAHERSAGAAPQDVDPCLYCGLDDNEMPYEDTEEHRNTSQHQWAVFDS